MIYIKIIKFIKLTIRKINKVFFSKTMKYIQTTTIKSTIKTYTVVLIMIFIQTIIKLTNKKTYTVVLIIIMS